MKLHPRMCVLVMFISENLLFNFASDVKGFWSNFQRNVMMTGDKI